MGNVDYRRDSLCSDHWIAPEANASPSPSSSDHWTTVLSTWSHWSAQWPCLDFAGLLLDGVPSESCSSWSDTDLIDEERKDSILCNSFMIYWLVPSDISIQTLSYHFLTQGVGKSSRCEHVLHVFTVVPAPPKGGATDRTLQKTNLICYRNKPNTVDMGDWAFWNMCTFADKTIIKCVPCPHNGILCLAM